MRKIEVVSYDPNWPALFEAEAERVMKALGNNCLKIHHIGSTSVPGLAAKPIIDMIPVVKDITAVDPKNPEMIALGYEAKGELGIPFRRYFQKGTDLRTHNIHVFEEGSSEIERHLKFRDWMREHAEDREAYSNLKQDLAKRFSDDIMAYCLGKGDFVAGIDKKAGWKGFRLVMALTPEEWRVYRELEGNKEGRAQPPAETPENHFHFVMYKGDQIAAAAHIEFQDNSQAKLHFIGKLLQFKDLGLEKTMRQLLKKWVGHQGRELE